MGKRRLSSRSRMPPCPGIIQPESLAPKARFKADSQRSPNWARMLIAAPSPSASPELREEGETTDHGDEHRAAEPADRALDRLARAHRRRELVTPRDPPDEI